MEIEMEHNYLGKRDRLQPLWPKKICQMSIKVAQKWFH